MFFGKKKNVPFFHRTAVLTAVGVWVATQAGLSLALDRILPQLRDPLYADKEAKLVARLAAKADGSTAPACFVQFGSSRTASGLRGDDVEATLEPALGRPAVAFNFGIPAAGPLTHLVNLRRLLASGRRPDLVLIELLPPAAAGQVPVPTEHHFLRPERLRADEARLVIAHDFPAEATADRRLAAALVPAYGHRFPILGRLAPRWLPLHLRYDSSRATDAVGWQKPFEARVTPERYRAGLAQARLEYFDLLQTLTFDGPAAMAVGECLARCRRAGVPAGLVLMPEGSDFRAFYPPAVEARLGEFVGRVTRDNGAELIDARRWVADGDFADGHHLLPAGATTFTAKLTERVTRLLGGRAVANRQAAGRLLE